MKYLLSVNRQQTFLLKESVNLHKYYLSGSEEEHIDYCFDIYDLNSDGFISREEMLNMMKTALGRQGLEEDQDEGVKVIQGRDTK